MFSKSQERSSLPRLVALVICNLLIQNMFSELKVIVAAIFSPTPVSGCRYHHRAMDGLVLKARSGNNAAALWLTFLTKSN